MIIDTHAHLYYVDLLNNLDEILERAANSGINKIILPSTNIQSAAIVLKLTQEYKMIYAAIGLHPGDLKDSDAKEIYEIEGLLKESKVVAVGEIGLDYYWDTTYNEKQKFFFDMQLELAEKHDLPAIIHTRNSIEDAISIVKKRGDTRQKYQFHCFSGSIDKLNDITGIENAYVSFCGNITYKNFNSKQVVASVPLDRLVFETDTPYLPPVPFRGKKNEPSYIINTINKIAEIKMTETDELIKQVYRNTIKLFNKLI